MSQKFLLLGASSSSSPYIESDWSSKFWDYSVPEMREEVGAGEGGEVQPCQEVPSSLEEWEVEDTAFRFNVPSSFDFHRARTHDRPLSSRKNKFCIFRLAFELGFRLPIHPFIASLLSWYDLAPVQLVSNSYLFITAFIVVCCHIGIPPSLEVFRYLFTLKEHSQAGPGFFYVKSRRGSSFLRLPSKFSSHKGWKSSYFWVSKAADAPEWGFRISPLKALIKIDDPVPEGVDLELVKLIRTKDYSADTLVTRDTLQEKGIEPTEARGRWLSKAHLLNLLHLAPV